MRAAIFMLAEKRLGVKLEECVLIHGDEPHVVSIVSLAGVF